MDQWDALPIAGTEAGGATGFARHPFFSPDGQWIAFWQERQLRKVPISGGPHVTIWDSPTLAVWLGASWGPDDEILLGDGLRGILHVRATGGQAEPLITLKKVMTGLLSTGPAWRPVGALLAASRWCGGIPKAGRRAVAHDRRAADH